jgi:hypothetical protein
VVALPKPGKDPKFPQNRRQISLLPLTGNMRLADHVTLHFNNNMSTAAVFLDTEKAFDTTWHPGFLYKLPKLQFSTSLIKLLTHFFRKENSESR